MQKAAIDNMYTNESVCSSDTMKTGGRPDCFTDYMC